MKAWTDRVARLKEKGEIKSGTQGEGVNSSWMEDEDGNRVDITRQKTILREARLTWLTMRDFGVELANHGDVTGPVLEYFYALMETKFFELRLCADHWKADQIWRENFSSWKQPKREARATLNTPKDDGDEAPHPVPPSKTVSGV